MLCQVLVYDHSCYFHALLLVSLLSKSTAGTKIMPNKREIDHHKTVSENLYNVLENIGVSVDVRKTFIETATLTEIIGTIHREGRLGVIDYIFGSRYEGSTTYDMNADVDTAHICLEFPVVNSASECINVHGQHSFETFLIIPDKYAGYVKLQLLFDGIPCLAHKGINLETEHANLRLEIDSNDRIYLVLKQKINNKFQREGPVLLYSSGKCGVSHDDIFCLNCKSWPVCAAEWLTRKRHYGWPSVEQINTCKSLGFLLVQAANPKCDEPEKLWRISFSRQERLFVSTFNSVQMKCYILLKLINREFIEYNIQEETLTSYHCKTCMFYCKENTPCEFWTQENLVSCLVMCLRQILVWVAEDNCPNYFIPGENMFDRIRSQELKKKLEVTLYVILIFCDIEVLLQQIKSDEIGKQLRGYEVIKHRSQHGDKRLLVSKRALCIISQRQFKIQQVKLVIMSQVITDVLTLRNTALFWLYDSKLAISISNFQKRLSELERMKVVTDHSEIESQLAISLYEPFIRLSLLSQMVARRVGYKKELLEERLMSEEWKQLDVLDASSKLKQAAAMLTLGYTKSSGDILKCFSNTDAKFPLCNCAPGILLPHPDDLVAITSNRPNITIRDLLCDVYQPCVVFLPTEQRVTPAPINYEMIRSFAQPEISDMDKFVFYWYKWAIVEGLFLSHFLFYLCYKAHGNKHQAMKAIKEMAAIIKGEESLHTDTSLNLLGWVHKDNGDLVSAIECWKKSLQLHPTRNASCWHLCFLICNIYQNGGVH